MHYIGLDLHKKKVYGTVLDEKGTIVKQGHFSNTTQGFTQFLQGINHATVALEALGFSYPTYDLLTGMGHTVHLAHPLKTRIIGEAKIKTDKIDATALAHLLRSDLLPTSYVPDKHMRHLRDIVRHRAYLVRMRTRLKNKIHTELAKNWIQPPHKNIFTHQGRTWLYSLHNTHVHRYLGLIDHLDDDIHDLSTHITRHATENRDTQLLMTIPGIHHYSALMLLSEIGDSTRFPNSHRLCSYAGLVPSTHQSGNELYHGHIIKQGSRWLRWILIQCVHTHIKYDTHLTRFYHRVAQRKGKKIALVATASKLLRIIYQMLNTHEPFHPQGYIPPHGTSNLE